MPTDNLYTGLMAEMRDYLAEVLDDADYPAAVDYLAEIVDGHSVFEIPVIFFDRNMAVIADTTAMSQPHEISYTLHFDSATLAPVK